MRLLDIFRRPDSAQNTRIEQAQEETTPLPENIEPPPASTGKVAEKSLAKRASEEDAA